MRAPRVLILAAVLWLFPLVASAAPIVINFDSLSDLDPITTQFLGLTFSDATVLSAGVSLNEFEFPPKSGTNVAFDDSGPMAIAFTSPIFSFGGYFTYLEPLTLTAFDALNNSVATATSAFSSNLALSGDAGSSPNEFLQVLVAGGISRVLIAGNPAGGSFTLDDATVTAPTSVPEPSTFTLVALGGLFVRRAARRRR